MNKSDLIDIVIKISYALCVVVVVAECVLAFNSLYYWSMICAILFIIFNAVLFTVVRKFERYMYKELVSGDNEETIQDINGYYRHAHNEFELLIKSEE